MKNSLITRIKMVNDVLVKHDPMGLISAGAPLDEYEYEAVEIVRGLKSWSGASQEGIHQWCKHIFEEQFSAETTKSIAWEPIVKDIFEVFL